MAPDPQPSPGALERYPAKRGRRLRDLIHNDPETHT